MAALILLALTSGCVLPGREPASVGINVRNETTQALTLEMQLADRTLSIPPPLEAGTSTSYLVLAGTDPKSRVDLDQQGCTKGVLIARSLAGVEVARHEPGLCARDTWVVESP